ncbi:MAG TPA: cytochrome P450 [Acidimicrobiia bacterium]|jgi:cytochrome P450 family 142 subfamily A polypeptide 1|nr:cytochrome P450 [Acidimicrobiia bacterium]
MSGGIDLDIDLTSGEFWGRNPHEELAWLRAHSPVHWDERGGVWGITRFDHVKEVEGDAATFSNAQGIRPDTGPTPMLIDLDDPEHRRRRQLVNEGFTPKRVRALEPKVRAIVDRLIDQVCEAGECDFVWDIAAWLPLVMIGDALGVDPVDHPTLMTWSDDLLRGQGQSDEALVGKMLAAFEGYSAYAARVIEDRRGCPRDDLMSALVHAEVDGERLDDGALLFDSLLILIGGDETTRHVISGGAFQVLQERSHWERLLADRALVVPAVEEMLRWVSPIKNMARTATRDVDFHGAQIHAGDKLVLLYPSANRDEDHFVDPFRFDITRNPNDHVAFGFGPHFCLGSSLARIELRVMFEQLLERLPDLHLVDDTEPAHRPANFVSGYESMRVAFTPAARSGA